MPFEATALLLLSPERLHADAALHLNMVVPVLAALDAVIDLEDDMVAIETDFRDLDLIAEPRRITPGFALPSIHCFLSQVPSALNSSGFLDRGRVALRFAYSAVRSRTRLIFSSSVNLSVGCKGPAAARGMHTQHGDQAGPDLGFLRIQEIRPSLCARASSTPRRTKRAAHGSSR